MAKRKADYDKLRNSLKTPEQKAKENKNDAIKNEDESREKFQNDPDYKIDKVATLDDVNLDQDQFNSAVEMEMMTLGLEILNKVKITGPIKLGQQRTRKM